MRDAVIEATAAAVKKVIERQGFLDLYQRERIYHRVFAAVTREGPWPATRRKRLASALAQVCDLRAVKVP